MPLPSENIDWPPKEWAGIRSQMSVWDAWWTGDTAKLAKVYQESNSTSSVRQHGVFGVIKRFFWGRPNNGGSRPSRSDLHVPIAADLCATSADILYGNVPKLESIAGKDAETTVRVNEYVEGGLLQQLVEGAEMGAALGGRYHQVVWDQAISSEPFTITVAHDHALPEFRWGKLAAVTFWTVLAQDNNKVVRHIERHELDSAGNGLTLHGLYEGTSDKLGKKLALTDHTATAGLQVDKDGVNLYGRTPGLAVVYVPNVTPNRAWRTNPQGRHLGRSDLDGIESLMDALDEAFNSLMRDLRLGKARIYASRSMLENRTPGNGQSDLSFDLDRELFVGLEGLGPLKDASPITPQQFKIRVEEHQKTIRELIGRIYRGARYSAATFDDLSAANMTATEVLARQSSTATTRERKIRFEKPALLALIRKMLAVDSAIFHTPGLAPENLTVDFQPLIQETSTSMAQTVATLNAADALSLETKVAMAHPEWSPEDVQDEVERIKEESPLASPDQWRPDFSGDPDEEPDPSEP